MKINITLISGFIFCNGLLAQEKIIYTDATTLTLVGKAIPTNSFYHRIDTLIYNSMPASVKKLFTNSAGLSIAFTTNSDFIEAKWCVTDKKAKDNMTPIAQKGLDLYIKQDGKWQFAGVGKPSGICSNSLIVKNMNNKEKECLLYLPLYDEIKQLEIGISPDAGIRPLPNPFRKRIIMYGSSILQGASASRPGMAYPSRLARETGLNLINLGLSGNGKMEKPVADMLASILNIDGYILDCVPNCTPEQIKERTAYLVNTIRKQHPDIPIIMIQSIIRESGNFDLKIKQRVQLQNEYFKVEYQKLIDNGVKNLYFIDGSELLGSDHEATTDGVHPNDIGFDRILKILRPYFLSIFPVSQ